MVGSEVIVQGGRGWGARASAHQQIFRLDGYVARPGSNPYLPNCNMAVRRADLEAVGDHPGLRSGGDADQLVGAGASWAAAGDDPAPGCLAAVSGTTCDKTSATGVRTCSFGGPADPRGPGCPPSGPPWPRFRLIRRGVRVTTLRVAGALLTDLS